jgi:Calcineurin-like phosphoesterase
VVLVGDLIGKGPASKEVVRFVRTRLARVVCVMGNHDEVLAEYHRALACKRAQLHAARSSAAQAHDDHHSTEPACDSVPAASSVTSESADVAIVPPGADASSALPAQCAAETAEHGSACRLTGEQRAEVLERCAIKEEYLRLYESELDEEDRHFLCTMPLWCRLPRSCFVDTAAWCSLPEEVLIVHAGMDPRRDLDHQKRKHLLNMRTIESDGKPSKAGDGEAWVNSWHGPQLVGAVCTLFLWC